MYCFWVPDNLYTKAREKHPFHLVDPSPWPAFTALGAFGITFGFLSWFSDSLLNPFIFSFLAICYFMYRWFQDIITETSYQGHHTRRVVKGLKYGMLLFLVSETMFFFSFFLAYFYYSLSPSIWIGGVWPPKGIVPLTPCIVATGNTFLLLSSGVTLTWAHAALMVGDRVAVIKGVYSTMVLAGLFTYFQYQEYKFSGIHMNDSVFGSIFFMITGFHGFHVIIGAIFVCTCFFRVCNADNITFTRQQHFGFLAALWYWHFVDVIWLFVFFLVYVWGSWGSWVRMTGDDGLFFHSSLGIINFYFWFLDFFSQTDF